MKIIYCQRRNIYFDVLVDLKLPNAIQYEKDAIFYGKRYIKLLFVVCVTVQKFDNLTNNLHTLSIK